MPWMWIPEVEAIIVTIHESTKELLVMSNLRNVSHRLSVISMKAVKPSKIRANSKTK